MVATKVSGIVDGTFHISGVTLPERVVLVKLSGGATSVASGTLNGSVAEHSTLKGSVGEHSTLKGRVGEHPTLNGRVAVHSTNVSATVAAVPLHSAPGEDCGTVGWHKSDRVDAASPITAVCGTVGWH